MSTYPAARVCTSRPEQIPTLGNPSCGDPMCDLAICTGPESHGVKKPWFMTQTPVQSLANNQPDSIVLIKMDGWVLEKYLESDKESQLFQYCPSMQWKKQLCITEIRAGLCDDCCETIPEEMVAAYTMHNWTMLQQYDADMKQYGPHPYDPVPTEAKIEVYR